jgi:hypothetical protein
VNPVSCALYARVRNFWRTRQCRLKGHQWIVKTEFHPPPKFENGLDHLKFNILLMLGCCMGLPELGICGLGITDIERMCARCDKYEKGSDYGELSPHEALIKTIRWKGVTAH